MTRYEEVVSRVEHWQQHGAIVDVSLDNLHFIYDQVKWLEEEFTEVTSLYTKRLKTEFDVSNSYYDIAAESYKGNTAIKEFLLDTISDSIVDYMVGKYNKKANQ